MFRRNYIELIRDTKDPTKPEAASKARIKEKEHKSDPNGKKNVPSPPKGTLSTYRDRGSRSKRSNRSREKTRPPKPIQALQ